MGWDTAYLNTRLSAGHGDRAPGPAHRPASPLGARHDPDLPASTIRCSGAAWSIGQRLLLPECRCCTSSFRCRASCSSTSPIAYLIFGQNIVAAAAFTIVTYALPHLLLAVLVNERIQRRYRRAFWARSTRR
ncbi:hypothetical protein ACRAWD_26975 [Caulobacter segnis]